MRSARNLQPDLLLRATVPLAVLPLPSLRLDGGTDQNEAIAAAWGEPWPDPDPLLAPIENKLPRAGARVAAVRRFLDQPGDPLELLRTVLPFNFH